MKSLIAQSKYIMIILMMISTLCLSSCSEPRPHNTKNVCSIFTTYPHWYWDAKISEERWGIPVYVLMAIMKQESDFQAQVKPSRVKLLHLIPWRRRSSAFGYSQVLDGTWKKYQNEVGHGFAARDDFSDGVDFIGWFCNRAHRYLHIRKDDAYRLYLAYHEGIIGYKERTYLHKHGLIKIAHRVSWQAKEYHTQLNRCEKHLKPKPFWWFKLF